MYVIYRKARLDIKWTKFGIYYVMLFGGHKHFSIDINGKMCLFLS